MSIAIRASGAGTVPQWLTTATAGALLGLSASQVARLARQGDVPGAVQPGRAWWIPTKWVEARLAPKIPITTAADQAATTTDIETTGDPR